MTEQMTDEELGKEFRELIQKGIGHGANFDKVGARIRKIIEDVIWNNPLSNITTGHCIGVNEDGTLKIEQVFAEEILKPGPLRDVMTKND